MPVYQNKETKKYYCKFYYTDINGNKKQKKKEGFKTQREAKAYEMDFISKALTSPAVPFDSLCAAYIADCEKRLKASTCYTKASTFKAVLVPYFGNMPICEITPLKIRKFHDFIMKKYNNKLTQKYISSQLAACLNFAVKFYGLQKNPCTIAGSIGSLKRDTFSFWTLEEFNKFIAVLKQPKNTDKQKQVCFYLEVVFTTLFYTGLRIGELLALNVGDYDPQEKTLSVSKALFRIRKQDIITTPKTKTSIRVVTLPVFLCSLLNEYISKLYSPSESDRLFCYSQAADIRRQLKIKAAAAGVPAIRVHDLRHSHASLLVNMDINPLSICKRLGHKDIQTTLNIYSHLYKDKEKAIASALDNLFMST